jgi:preprotein translocase subunit SecG
MLIFATVVHVVLCVFMIFVILLQPGKDAGMGAALGGGVATSAFGGRGAVTFLSKVTAVCAALFFLTSLGLSFVGMSGSVAARVPPPKSAPAPTPQAPEKQPEAAPPAPASSTDAPPPRETPGAQPAQRTNESPGDTAPPSQPPR